MLCEKAVFVSTIQLIRLGTMGCARESCAVGFRRAGVVVAVCGALHTRCVKVILPQIDYQGAVAALRIGWIANGATTSGRGPIVVSVDAPG
jgi:hypothetical protein